MIGFAGLEFQNLSPKKMPIQIEFFIRLGGSKFFKYQHSNFPVDNWSTLNWAEEFWKFLNFLIA